MFELKIKEDSYRPIKAARDFGKNCEKNNGDKNKNLHWVHTLIKCVHLSNSYDLVYRS